MVNRDLTNNVQVVESLRPAVYGDAADGQTVDLLGSDSVAVAVSVGAIVGSEGDATVGLEESDAAGSGFTAVAAANILGTIPEALAANTAYQFGYIGNKRYLRVTVDEGAETSVAASAVVIKGNLDNAPAGYVVAS